MFVLMERKHQLSNVAFGGAWSEQIAWKERLIAALELVEAAAIDAGDRDPRGVPEIEAALRLAAMDHPKGAMLIMAWERGAALRESGRRIAELGRIARLLGEGQAGIFQAGMR